MTKQNAAETTINAANEDAAAAPEIVTTTEVKKFNWRMVAKFAGIAAAAVVVGVGIAVLTKGGSVGSSSGEVAPTTEA